MMHGMHPVLGGGWALYRANPANYAFRPALKSQMGIKVQGVVVAGIAPAAIIIFVCAVKSGVSHILGGETQIHIGFKTR
jgi:hypothetical protein